MLKYVIFVKTAKFFNPENWCEKPAETQISKLPGHEETQETKTQTDNLYFYPGDQICL
jgi:hypothetical protein